MSHKKLLMVCTIIIVFVVCMIVAFMIPMPITSPSTNLTLSSSAFKDDGMIPALYTCKGGDVVPPLNISGVPKRAVSLTLIMEDPDTTMGTFDHWVVFNMDPKVSQIKEGEEPVGIHGKTSTGDTASVSLCPPTGIHRYIFSLYASDMMLPLTEGATKAQVLDALKGHTIGMTKMTGKFGQ